MKISLHVPISQWRATDFGIVLAGGKHDLPNDDVPKLSAGFLRAIAAASAVGVVEILECDAKAASAMDGVVEPDEESLAKYEDAVQSGLWLEGHLANVVAQREEQLGQLARQLELARAAGKSLDDEDVVALIAQAAFAEYLREEAASLLAALKEG